MAALDPVNEPLADGCQRNPAGLLAFASPEWAFVHGRSAGDPVRVVEGSVTLPHTAGEDLPESHASYDFDMDVAPDAPYAGLLAGDPAANGGAGNGNYADDADRAKLHVEWESGVLPTYAWPTEGDRVKLWGQWVWDCGHWGEGIETDQSDPQGSLESTGDYFLPGQIEGPAPAGLRGEQTELHPMQAVVVDRAAPWRARRPESESDVFISDQGTHAYAEERCGQQLNPLPGLSTYGGDYAVCATDASNQRQPIAGRSYTFTVPAPPRPSPDSKLRWHELRMAAWSGAHQQVRVLPGGLEVTVRFDSAPPAGASQQYGASFFAGWTADPSPRPRRLELVLQSIRVNHSLDPNPGHPQQLSAPPGEYNLYLSLNGYWSFIGGGGLTDPTDGSSVPGLGSVMDGQSFTVDRAVDFFVPSGAPVRVDFSGRECDLPKMAPCARDAEVSDANDAPGEIVSTFPTADAALGEHTVVSPVNANYQVVYAIRDAPGPGGASPPGSSGA
jgi:hypothetical protein